MDMTPSGAILRAIYDLRHELDAWKERDDPHGVRPDIAARIASLEQAQRELAELREIKKALAVLNAATSAH